MDKLLSMKQLGYTIRRFAGLILGLTIIGAIVGGLLSVILVKPTYSASTVIVITQRHQDTQDQSVSDALNQSQYDTQLLATYNDVFTSPEIFADVSTALQDKGLSYSASDLQQMVTVKNNSNSRAFSISVEAKKAGIAAKVANTVASVFSSKTSTMIDSQQSVKVINRAGDDTKKIEPSIKLFVVAGVVVGFLASVGFALLAEIFNDTVKNEDYSETKLGIASMGVVSFSTKK